MLVFCSLTHVLAHYVRKWHLLLVLNLPKQTIKENKEIKVKKNIRKISENFQYYVEKIEAQAKKK